MPPDLLHFAAHHRKNAVRSPAPSPKTPQAAGPCSWACRRLLASPPQSERNKAPKPPTRGAWARLPRAEGAGRRHCRPPCSWGLGASTSSRRRWPAALPPPCSWGGRAVLRASSRCKGKGRGGSLRRCLAPLGQGALPVCGVDAVCPCGAKALQSGAPDFGRVAGESCLRSGLPIRNGWQARWEDGSMPSYAP